MEGCIPKLWDRSVAYHSAKYSIKGWARVSITNRVQKKAIDHFLSLSEYGSSGGQEDNRGDTAPSSTESIKARTKVIALNILMIHVYSFPFQKRVGGYVLIPPSIYIMASEIGTGSADVIPVGRWRHWHVDGWRRPGKKTQNRANRMLLTT